MYDGGGQLVAEYSTALSQTPQVSYLTTDHLGSPRIITDSTGQIIARKDFSAFGEETLTAQRTESLGYKPENIRQDYTGYQKDDESGLEFAQARYFNSAHGRFTSVDPLTASANVKDPQTFNRYSYAMNSPYKFTDPLGLISSSTGANGGRAWCSTCATRDDDDSWIPDPEEASARDSQRNAANSTPAAESTASARAATTAAPPADPPAPTAEQNAEGGAQQESNPPPAVNAEFGTGGVFITEHPAGNTLLPPAVQNIAKNPVSDTQIQRRWNVSATMRLIDSEGNEFSNYEYEISYSENNNPNPDNGRVEGRQSTYMGQAFLGTFVLAQRRFGTEQNTYNYDLNIPSNTITPSGTIKIYSRDGSTAEIKFQVYVNENGSSRIKPETTQVKWVKPSK